MIISSIATPEQVIMLYTYCILVSFVKRDIVWTLFLINKSNICGCFIKIEFYY